MFSSRLLALTPYTPGEQPRDRRYIKLNTNENPFPPAPAVQQVLANFSAEELRLYPDPEALELRRAFAERYGLAQDQVFCGNGSDEVLALIFYSFFDRAFGPVLFPDITYSFYPVFCSFHGLDFTTIPLDDEYRIRITEYIEKASGIEYSGIIFANPNAPTGIALSLAEIEVLLKQVRSDRLVVIDEAYVDFGAESAVSLIERFPNLLIAGTLSKSYALAGLRLGYAFGAAPLIEALHCAKDSFNSYPISRLGQKLGCAALGDPDYFFRQRDRLMAIRESTADELRRREFRVLPSMTNFLFTSPPDGRAVDLFSSLKKKGILVRYFDKARIDNFLRISIGTAEEMKRLIEAIDEG